MEVTRIASFAPRKGRYARILGVRTPRADVEIYVTQTGMVRVWKNGKELK